MNTQDDLALAIQNLSTKAHVVSQTARDARTAYLKKNTPPSPPVFQRFMLGVIQGIGIGFGIFIISILTIIGLNALGY